MDGLDGWMIISIIYSKIWFHIQSSTIISRSIKTLYYIQYCSHWDRSLSEVELTKDTPYLTLTGELWDVFCEDSGEIIKALHCSLYDNEIYVLSCLVSLLPIKYMKLIRLSVLRNPLPFRYMTCAIDSDIPVLIIVITDLLYHQGSFCAWAQPMRDDVTL